MYKIYQVENSETLESIANKLNTDVETLKKINGIKGSVSLRPGSYLIDPMVDDRYPKYVIQPGDSLYEIAKRYNTTVDMIAKLNGLEASSYIYPNQEILIPTKNYKFYITENGDTITSVAEKLNVNVLDLLNQNETLYLEDDQMIIYKWNSEKEFFLMTALFIINFIV